MLRSNDFFIRKVLWEVVNRARINLVPVPVYHVSLGRTGRLQRFQSRVGLNL